MFNSLPHDESRKTPKTVQQSGYMEHTPGWGSTPCVSEGWTTPEAPKNPLKTSIRCLIAFELETISTFPLYEINESRVDKRCEMKNGQDKKEWYLLWYL